MHPKSQGMIQHFESLGVEGTSVKLTKGEFGDPSNPDDWRAALAEKWLNENRASEAALYVKQQAISAMDAAEAALRSASAAERAASAAERDASAAERQARWAMWAAIIATIAAAIATKEQIVAIILGSL